MNKTIGELIASAADLRANPSNIKRVMFSAIDQLNDETNVSSRYDIVTPGNPFVFLMEAAIATQSAGMLRNEIGMRKLYPSLAQTWEDLYPHMSDDDYLNRFATAGTVFFTIQIPVDEIRESAQLVGSVRQVTIPRYSSFTVDNTPFTFQYPINIRVATHGGLQVVYDLDQPSPIQVKESNVVDAEVFIAPEAMGAAAGKEILDLRVPITQCAIKSYKDQVNSSTGFNKTYNFVDKFLALRAFHYSNNEEYQEIRVTHSDQVYDELKPTVVVKVFDGYLTVRVPQIYITKGLIKANLRLDVYTTLGNITLNLQRYTPGMFDVRWDDFNRLNNAGVQGFLKIQTVSFFSNGSVTGGYNGISFEALREQVIYGGLGVGEARNFEQLQLKLEARGYELIREVDNITNRMMLATRAMEGIDNAIVASPMGVIAQTFQETFEIISQTPNVVDNGNRCTIKSGTLFYLDNGNLKLVPAIETAYLDTLSGDALATEFSRKEYLYNPFHRVLDINDDEFATRCVYLDKPEILHRGFVEENESALLQLASGAVAIEATDTGFRIIMATISGDTVKQMRDDQIHVQLLFTPVNNNVFVAMNGTLINKTASNERVYEFNIDTRFDVDNKYNLLLEGFLSNDMQPRTQPLALTTWMHLVFAVSDYSIPGMTGSNIDSVLGLGLVPDGTVGITQEKINVRFGQALDYLWNRSRPVVSSQEPRRYEEDVLAVWEDTVYETNPATGVVVVYYDEETQRAYRKVLHNKGDPILDSEGRQTVKFPAGTLKRTNGVIDFESTRSMAVQIDVVLFEGLFTIVQDTAALNYKDAVTTQLVNWVKIDIPYFNRFVLENTKLWFTPKKTLGQVPVRVGENIVTSIDSNQSFAVVFYLTEENLRNQSLRKPLTTAAISAIAEVLSGTTVRVRDISELIRKRTLNDIIDVKVSSLGENRDYDLVTLSNVDSKLTIAKRLVVLGDGKLSIDNDVTVEFLPHQQQVSE
jgi:hypothetical protein